jgi:hypothetical protein
MPQDLTNSEIDRQNILNNPYAIEEIRKAAGIKGYFYKEQYYFTKEQVARFFEVDSRTIDRYLEKNSEELYHNGYEVLRGNSLREFTLWIKSTHVNDIHVVHKVANLGLFNFRAFLNLSILR